MAYILCTKTSMPILDMTHLIVLHRKTQQYIQNIVLFFATFFFVLFWQEKHISILDSTYCFMDAVLWVDALEGFYAQDDLVVYQLDRPPLSLWMGAWLKHFGFTSTQSLQMVSRIAIAGVFGSFVVFLFRNVSLFAACIAIVILSKASSFVKLSVWLNAQMLCNFFFALHMCYGYHMIQSKKKEPYWKWATLGCFAGASVASKEQGIILMLMTIAALFSSMFFLKKYRFQRFLSIGAYIFGSLPLVGWYVYWLKDQLIHGEKWRIFGDDLDILQSQTNWNGLMKAQTTWGSFSNRFGIQDDLGGFLYQASRILLQDLHYPFLYSLAIGFGTSFILLCSKKMRQTNLGGFWWCVLHVATVLPLLIVPIFEPYHYSIVMIGTTGLLAWSIFHLHRFSILTVIPMLIALNTAFDHWGVRYHRSVELELQSCISNRIRPVRNWARDRLSPESILFFTDTLVVLDTLRYHQFISIYTLIPKCSENYYVVTSGLSNINHLFETDYKNDPKKSRQVKEIDAINKELWFVYQMQCESN